MCIICFKPAGVPMPTKDVLETCFIYNPDGAGFAIRRPGAQEVTFKKGFFTFVDLMDAIEKEGVKEDDDFAVHFRIATNGDINAKNCHPFRLIDDKKRAFSVGGVCKSVIFHNGVLSQKYAYDRKVSDTYLFTLSLAQKLKAGKLKDTQKKKSYIQEETFGNRILYFCAEEIILTGKWEQDENGCYFSNLSYTYGDFYPYHSTRSAKSVFQSGTLFTQKDFYADAPVCPVCGNYLYSRNISEYHDLWECDNCHAIFDSFSAEIELRGMRFFSKPSF